VSLLLVLIVLIIIVQWHVTWQIMSSQQRALPRSLVVSTEMKSTKTLLSDCERFNCPSCNPDLLCSSAPSCSPSPPPLPPTLLSHKRAIRHVFETFYGDGASSPVGEISIENPIPHPLSVNETFMKLRASSSALDILAADLHIDIKSSTKTKTNHESVESDSERAAASASNTSFPILPSPTLTLAPSSSSSTDKLSSAIHAFLITQDYFTFTCELLQSAILNGIVPHIIGFGGPGQGRGLLDRGVVFNWGLGKPILSLRAPIEKLIARLGGETLILVTDAHDTLIMTSGKALALKFRAFQAHFPLARVAIAAERSCFPITQAECYRFPPTEPPGLPYTNLNSGTWIGEGRHILNVLDAIELSYPNGLVNYTMNDQAALQYLYLDRFARSFLGLQLDYANELFMCMHMAQGDIEIHPKAPYRTCNKLSLACPAVLHFNGGSKDLQKPIDHGISTSLAVNDKSSNGEQLRRALAEYTLPEVEVSFRSFCCDRRWVDVHVGNKVPVTSMRCEKNESNWAE
jgi:hypothetical protein